MLDEILCHKFDELILKAKDVAMDHIQKMISKTPSDFVWIQSESIRPSFDDIRFQYENQVFSVLIKIFHNGHEITPPKRQKTFVDETRKHNMIPCIFPIEFEFLPPDCQPGEPNPIDPENLPEYDLIPRFSEDLNLFHAETDAAISL